ncbi:hypothetical protein TBLA_0F01320 [Henningerozyma blattae CBS 6284]|uniref:Large ribosomal subunit protein mL54 n=1 Tax=Henningerozyma blattae (strain ATCC 34711 / CBS 6284 / DSM 70876 / NBRC 10599 / NRRL Y-10934 / UCD 77-7) TaxID=1071380 RepID=I2H5M3_HENB6|nr:hypothetical protein TBLA_0F01320 [Tetrapisispora blattae CBS 6284]CCH61675.1 hypothetical protein TBLA_0F01320 [Tetrapisispora blattae CBS 6284]
MFARRSLSTFANRLLQQELMPAAKAAAKKTPQQAIKSSCPAGTELRLNVYKDGKDPVALEDEKYPPWLWSILTPSNNKNPSPMEAIAQRKKVLRKNNRDRIKQNNFLKQLK